jgi:hypothetical protein
VSVQHGTFSVERRKMTKEKICFFVIKGLDVLRLTVSLAPCAVSRVPYVVHPIPTSVQLPALNLFAANFG